MERFLAQELTRVDPNLIYKKIQKTVKQVGQLACKTQILPTALRYAAALNSECPPDHGAQFRLPHCDFYIAHPGSYAAALTPREPKFTKMGEDLSG